jgi:hypothetical protein
MDTWLAYAPVKNNPEDAAKVRFELSKISVFLLCIVRLLLVVKYFCQGCLFELGLLNATFD